MACTNLTSVIGRSSHAPILPCPRFLAMLQKYKNTLNSIYSLLQSYLCFCAAFTDWVETEILAIAIKQWLSCTAEQESQLNISKTNCVLNISIEGKELFLVLDRVNRWLKTFPPWSKLLSFRVWLPWEQGITSFSSHLLLLESCRIFQCWCPWGCFWWKTL